MQTKPSENQKRRDQHNVGGWPWRTYPGGARLRKTKTSSVDEILARIECFLLFETGTCRGAQLTFQLVVKANPRLREKGKGKKGARSCMQHLSCD